MRRLKNILLNTILIMGSCVFVLIISEIGVRIFIPLAKPKMIIKKTTPLNIEKKFELGKPFFEATFLSAEYTTQIKTNSEGFRDREHELNKPADVFRILIVGDSFTFGLGVEAHQTYSQFLQNLLNEKKATLKYEVFNMAIAGIGNLEGLQIIKYGTIYKPDLILLGLFVENRWNPGNGNDLYDNFKSWQGSKNKDVSEQGFVNQQLSFRTKIINYLNLLQRFLSEKSELYFLIMSRGGTFLRRQLIGLRKNQNQAELAFSWDITKGIFKKISTFAKEIDAEFVIVRIPFLYDVYSKDEDEASKILNEFGRENNIKICDLLVTFRNNKTKDLYYPADGHWKPSAHNLAAREIYNYLNNNDLLNRK